MSGLDAFHPDRSGTEPADDIFAPHQPPSREAVAVDVDRLYPL
ncbi:hypothetical protein [Mycolicibacterium sp. P1-5]|nr:hypothetical protein [Mycolicibacterium sp. P1-5]